MPDANALVLALALQRVPRLRSLEAARLVAAIGATWRPNARDLVAWSGGGRGPRRATLTLGRAALALQAAERDAAHVARLGWSWTVPGDAGYLPRLWRLSSPPLALFVRGTRPAGARPALAVVGTRRPSEAGRLLAAAAAREGAVAGAVIVAGLAVGIDTVAHRTAADLGRPTWAILPSSLDRPYPARNEALAERIVATGGALVSEYAPATDPRPARFVARDRLQAALSDAVLVVESTPHGGTMHTARLAAACGVPVWVLLTEADIARGRRSLDALAPRQRGPWLLWRAGARRVAVADLPHLLTSGPRASGPDG